MKDKLSSQTWTLVSTIGSRHFLDFAFHIWTMQPEILRSESFTTTGKSLHRSDEGWSGGGRTCCIHSAAEIRCLCLEHIDSNVGQTKRSWISSSLRSLLRVFHLLEMSSCTHRSQWVYRSSPPVFSRGLIQTLSGIIGRGRGSVKWKDRWGEMNSLSMYDHPVQKIPVS